MEKYIIVVAGGRGTRMGGDVPKQFLPLAGKRVLMHTLERMAEAIPDAVLVLALPHDQQDEWKRLCNTYGYTRRHRVGGGGETGFHAERCGAAIPVMPVVESLRCVEGEHSRAVDRSAYRAVQTPQVFDATQLKAAYSKSYSPEFTDDASVYEAYGYSVTLIDGNRENIKITIPQDIALAEIILSQQ